MACIEHMQKGNTGGYGTGKRNGKTYYLHRLAYADAHGIAVEDLVGVVRHTCDNPRCYNPQHLLLGTHADNTADMFARGRANTVRGEQHGHALLSATLIATIRDRYVPRCRMNGARALGRELGVSNSTIRDVLKQRTWKEN